MQVSTNAGAATGYFSALASNPSAPPLFLSFKPVVFTNTTMLSLWSVAAGAGNYSFDVTSMLVTIEPKSFLAQGNGIAHCTGSADAFCVFSVSAQWDPTNIGLATQIVEAYFGVYAVNN